MAKAKVYSSLTIGAALAAPNLILHPHFLRPSPPVKRRRGGRLPSNVVPIKSADRLRVGALAEIVNSTVCANNGLRVVITDFDPKSPFCWDVKSLGRDIQWFAGGAGQTATLRPRNLRRVWRGLSESERTRLRLLRGAP